jgi:16S rRNA (uracil1498-N3)-methyltransferase
VRFSAALRESAETRIFLDETGAPPLLRILPHDPAPPADAALLAGPEGGWTEEERAAAAASGWISASLGPQILRAETAVIAGLSVILNAYLA